MRPPWNQHPQMVGEAFPDRTDSDLAFVELAQNDVREWRCHHPDRLRQCSKPASLDSDRQLSRDTADGVFSAFDRQVADDDVLSHEAKRGKVVAGDDHLVDVGAFDRDPLRHDHGLFVAPRAEADDVAGIRGFDCGRQCPGPRFDVDRLGVDTGGKERAASRRNPYPTSVHVSVLQASRTIVVVMGCDTA